MGGRERKRKREGEREKEREREEGVREERKENKVSVCLSAFMHVCLLCQLPTHLTAPHLLTAQTGLAFRLQTRWGVREQRMRLIWKIMRMNKVK